MDRSPLRDHQDVILTLQPIGLIQKKIALEAAFPRRLLSVLQKISVHQAYRSSVQSIISEASQCWLIFEPGINTFKNKRPGWK